MKGAFDLRLSTLLLTDTELRKDAVKNVVSCAEAENVAHALECFAKLKRGELNARLHGGLFGALQRAARILDRGQR